MVVNKPPNPELIEPDRNIWRVHPYYAKCGCLVEGEWAGDYYGEQNARGCLQRGLEKECFFCMLESAEAKAKEMMK